MSPRQHSVNLSPWQYQTGVISPVFFPEKGGWEKQWLLMGKQFEKFISLLEIHTIFPRKKKEKKKKWKQKKSIYGYHKKIHFFIYFPPITKCSSWEMALPYHTREGTAFSINLFQWVTRRVKWITARLGAGNMHQARQQFQHTLGSSPIPLNKLLLVAPSLQKIQESSGQLSVILSDFGWSCVKPGVGLEDLHRSLPVQDILWFYNPCM